jgi:hypothetical protein
MSVRECLRTRARASARTHARVRVCDVRVSCVRIASISSRCSCCRRCASDAAVAAPSSADLCACLSACVRVRACAHACGCMYVFVRSRVHVCVCPGARVCTRERACRSVRSHVRRCVYAGACVCARAEAYSYRAAASDCSEWSSSRTDLRTCCNRVRRCNAVCCGAATRCTGAGVLCCIAPCGVAACCAALQHVVRRCNVLCATATLRRCNAVRGAATHRLQPRALLVDARSERSSDAVGPAQRLRNGWTTPRVTGCNGYVTAVQRL